METPITNKDFSSICKTNNFKNTPQRAKIYEIIMVAKDHPSGEQIYTKVKKIFPNISYNTVHTTLIFFSKIGLIEKVEGYSDAIKYEPQKKSHGHFRCIKCGKIVDFDYKQNIDDFIPNDLSNNKTIVRKRIIVEGYCTDCNK